MLEQRQVLATITRILGKDHPDTIPHAENLAHNLGCQAKYEESVAIHREVLATNKRVHGAKHANTLRAASEFARIVSDQSKYEELGGDAAHTVEMRKKWGSSCADGSAY